MGICLDVIKRIEKEENERRSLRNPLGVLKGQEKLSNMEVKATRVEVGGPCAAGGEVFDPVERPAHYNKGGIECLDAIDSAIEGLQGREAHYTACALKYLWRWPYKGQKVQDLLKARRYIDRLVCYIKAQDSNAS